PLVSDEGETLLFSVILDITGKKIAEASVLEYKDRLENLAETCYQQLINTQKHINQIMWVALLIQLLVIGLLLWNILVRRKTERKLQEKTTILEGLLNSIPDLIFFKNKSGVYLGSNDQFARYAGKTPAELVGQTDHQIFDAR